MTSESLGEGSDAVYNTFSDTDWATLPDEEQMDLDWESREKVEECHRILRTTFGHSDYKGKQKDIIAAAVSGRDVFVLAPTGLGKSLCFQIPAASDKHGLTLVISPLLALMKNQVSSLRQKSVSVASLTSETPPEERTEITQELKSGNPETRLLYTTPERFANPEFLGLLTKVYKNNALNRLVVDEAHCISEWGHDFREEYRRIGVFRQKFPDVPIMALTATATAEVTEDIIRSLRMSENNLFRAIHPCNRANLFYEVRYTSDPNPDSPARMAEICDYICGLHRKRGKPSSGIIYCRTKKTCDALSAYLRSKGLNSRPYHRGVPKATLDKTLREWTPEEGKSGVDVVVATIAFGLGIDKGDVRFIIHYDLPKSFEGYYQETGRAGRNGSPSKCVLYYSREDYITVSRWVGDAHKNRVMKAEDLHHPQPSQRSMSSLEKLSQFAENTNVCRHVLISRYFGEDVDDTDPEVVTSLCNMMCDVCKYPEKTKRRVQALTPRSSIRMNEGSLRLSDRDQNLPQKSGSSSNSYSNLKRSSHGEANQPLKKVKTTSYAAPLVTKAFGSASSLKKPFKTPFKTPFKEPEAGPSLIPAQPPADLEYDQFTGQSDPEEEETPAHSEDIAPSSETSASLSTVDDSVEIPYVDYELEDPTSAKVTTHIRRKGVDALRRILHLVFTAREGLWKRLKRSPVSTDKRAEVIASVAVDLEYESILSFSTTPEGYQARISSKVEGLRRLSDTASWDGVMEECYEDAQEAIEIFKRHCK